MYGKHIPFSEYGSATTMKNSFTAEGKYGEDIIPERKDVAGWVQPVSQENLFKHGQGSTEDASHGIEKQNDHLTKGMELLAAKEQRIAALSLQPPPERPAGFNKKLQETLHIAKATLMEVKFLKAMSEIPSLRSQKIKGRVTSMSRHGLSPDDMQPTLWKRVTQEMSK